MFNRRRIDKLNLTLYKNAEYRLSILPINRYHLAIDYRKQSISNPSITYRLQKTIDKYDRLK